MSDYTELRARLKHDCMCDRETMYQCDYCTASYALESQAREIAELSKARDGYYHTAADALAKRDATQRKLAEAWELLREARDYSTRPPASLTCDCDTCKAKRSFPRRVAAALVEKP